MIDPDTLKLVAITDDIRDGVGGLTARAHAAVRGGATMVQLRLKNADPIVLLEVARAIVAALPVPVIVNDRTDVAIASGAAGVHLGADDLPVAAARAIAIPGFIIGASVGSDAEVANAAQADYVGIGPFFATGSKADAGDAIGAEEFMRLAALCARPAVAIGGITAANVGEIAITGAAGVAVLSGIFAAEDPERAARAIRIAMSAGGDG